MDKVQVDKGAIKFVLRGAHIMCVGLTSPGGDVSTDLPVGHPVAVHAEVRKEKTVGMTWRWSLHKHFLLTVVVYLYAPAPPPLSHADTLTTLSSVSFIDYCLNIFCINSSISNTTPASVFIVEGACVSDRGAQDEHKRYTYNKQRCGNHPHPLP